MNRLCLAALGVLLWSASLLAHGITAEQIQELTRQIQREPNNPALYVRRGELYRRTGNAKAALADYEQAQTLAPQMREIEFLRARLYYDAKAPEMTLLVLERLLDYQPAHAEAWLLCAQAHAQMGETTAAIRAYSQALARLPRPKADHFLARARLQMSVQRWEEALHGVTEAQAKLGPLVSLQLLALELEVKLQRWDAALARLEVLATQSPRQETWLVQRGEILLQAGRRTEAAQAFTAALAAIQALPEPLRKTKAMSDLATKVVSLLRSGIR